VVRDVVHSLPEPERSVITLRYGIDGEDAVPVSLREAARRLNLRPADVSRIERRALEDLAVRRELAALTP
jgi:DNA-directed RNA polymerase specialized sigma subunit